MTHEQTKDTDFSKNESGSMAGSVASDIKEAMTHKFGEAVTYAHSQADDAKAGVANEVKDVANALRRASDELRGGSAQERTLGQISTSLADASDAIRDKDVGEILDMASKVAREHPALFVGGAALLGFAISRYAKATSDQVARSERDKAALKKAQVDIFVNEGNPNIQPVQAAT